MNLIPSFPVPRRARTARGRGPRTVRTACAALLAAVSMSAVAATPVLAHDGHDHPEPARTTSPMSPGDRVDLRRARVATAKYHNVKRALRDGYRPTGGCVESESGVMGIHYINDALASDGGTFDVTRPELLLYVPGPFGPRLVGLEYFAPDTGQPAPHLFGQRFDGPMAGHEPGQPVHYDLHVWAWWPNPNGLFAQFNPWVSC
jgi:hypothetical protein